MATRRTIPYTGLLVHDERIRTAGPASTLDATGSSYQQAGPTAPGAVDVGSGVVLGLSGEQSSSVYLDVGRGGVPDPARGARLRWADSSTDTLLGWAPPSWVQYLTGYGYLEGSVCTDMVALDDGQVAVVSTYGLPQRSRCALYQPSTDTWLARADLPWTASGAGAIPAQALVALWQSPDDGAIYCLQADVDGAALRRTMLVRSTDLMVSWQTVAQASFTGGTLRPLVRKARWYRLPSGVHVLVVMADSALQVWRSTSGEDWSLVGQLTDLADDSSTQLPAADVALLPDGRLLYVYAEEVVDQSIVRVRLADALADPATAAVVDAVNLAGAVESVAICLDQTGRAWVLAGEVGQGVRVLRSIDYQNWFTDDGLQWCETGDGLEQTPRRTIQLDGGHLLCLADAGGTNFAPIFAHLGGWSSIEPWSVAAGLSARDSDRITWGAADTAAIPWQGQTVPQNVTPPAAYWSTTTTGTSSDTPSAFRRTITTTGGTHIYETAIALGDSFIAFFDVDPDTGGSTSSAQIGWEVQQNFSVTAHMRYTCRLYTGVGQSARLVRWDGTVVATLNLDPQRLQFLYLNEGSNRLEVYYRTPGSAAWVSWYQTNSPYVDTSIISGLTSYVRWGHLATGTATSHWRMVAAVANDLASMAQTAKRDQWRSTGSTAAARAEVLGRPLGQLPGQLGSVASYPAVTLLSVVPTAGVTATVQPAYAFPIDHLDPVSSPSPRQVWRSTDTSEQLLEWVLDAQLDSAGLTHWGLYVAGANFRTAVLERWDGAAWQTWASLDLGVSITYSRTGDTIQATSGSPRWMPQGTASGVQLGSSIQRRVAWQRSGYGSDAQVRMRARLEGAQVTDPASGLGFVLFPQGVAASLSAQDVRRVRLRIPGSQPTPTGYYEAGTIAIGPIYALGSPEDFGSGQSTLLDVQTQQLPGYQVRQRRSPPRRRWSLQVAESNVAGLRDSVAGYLAPDGASTLPIGLEGDTAPLLEGLLAQGLDAAPVLVLPAPPQTESGVSGYTTSETRRSVLWWGRLQQVAWDNVVGVLGSSELHRVATLTIDEDV